MERMSSRNGLLMAVDDDDTIFNITMLLAHVITRCILQIYIYAVIKRILNKELTCPLIGCQ